MHAYEKKYACIRKQGCIHTQKKTKHTHAHKKNNNVHTKPDSHTHTTTYANVYEHNYIVSIQKKHNQKNIHIDKQIIACRQKQVCTNKTYACIHTTPACRHNTTIKKKRMQHNEHVADVYGKISMSTNSVYRHCTTNVACVHTSQ